MTKDEVKKLRMNSPESLQFLNNATKFYNLMMMYRCAIREIQTKLEVLDDEFSVENNRNPISFIKTRIKKPNSIYNKLQKMGYEFTTENIQTYLNDVAGVRSEEQPHIPAATSRSYDAYHIFRRLLFPGSFPGSRS